MATTGAYPTPPGSGNAYPRRLVEHIFNFQSDFTDRAPDSYLLAGAPAYGDVITIAKPLVDYRVHGLNHGAFLELDDSRFAREIDVSRRRHKFFTEVARTEGSCRCSRGVGQELLLSLFAYRVAYVATGHSSRCRRSFDPHPGGWLQGVQLSARPLGLAARFAPAVDRMRASLSAFASADVGNLAVCFRSAPEVDQTSTQPAEGRSVRFGRDATQAVGRRLREIASRGGRCNLSRRLMACPRMCSIETKADHLTRDLPRRQRQAADPDQVFHARAKGNWIAENTADGGYP